MPKRATAMVATQRKGTQQLAPLIPDAIRVLFEHRPLTRDESPEDYDQLLAGIAQDVEPKTRIEWFWIKDIVDLAWEAHRLRRYKVLVIEVNMRKAGGRLLSPVFDPETPDYLPATQSETAVSAYQSGADEAVTHVREALDNLGLPEEALSAVAFVQSLPELEKIDQMLRSVSRAAIRPCGKSSVTGLPLANAYALPPRPRSLT